MISEEAQEMLRNWKDLPLYGDERDSLPTELLHAKEVVVVNRVMLESVFRLPPLSGTGGQYMSESEYETHLSKGFDE